MDPVVLPVLFGLGLAGMAVYRVLFSPRARAKRALRTARRKPIREVLDGEVVKICGKLRYQGTPLEAPLTGRACAGWTVVVQEQGRQGHTTIRDHSCVAFVVEDDSGRAVVDPVLVDLVLTVDRHLRSGLFELPSRRMAVFLRKHHERTHGWLLPRGLEYTEGALEEGEEVSVLGQGRWEPDPDPASATCAGYRGRATRLRIVDPPAGKMLVSDDPSTL